MRRTNPLPIAAVLVLGASLIVAGCSEEARYPEVSVKTPKVRSDGPMLTMSQWQQGVGEICRDAATQVGDASMKLARNLHAEPGAYDEAEISRRAFAVSKPLLEQQLQELAQLRPPVALERDYQEFIATLADELRWSGRIALLLGNEGSEEALHEADQGLAAAAVKVTRFVHRRGIEGCLLATGKGS